MSKLIVLTNENAQLISSLDWLNSATSSPLIAYLNGNFSLKETLQLTSIPLIYASKETVFDFRDANELFENFLPDNLTSLVKRIGYSNALELVLSNNLVDSFMAYQLRLINKVYTNQEFNEQVKRVSKLSLSAIELALEIAEKASHLSNGQAEILERYTFALRFTHSDQKEGMKAFLEKRPPNFSNPSKIL